jgi:hypothetical protein
VSFRGRLYCAFLTPFGWLCLTSSIDGQHWEDDLVTYPNFSSYCRYGTITAPAFAVMNDTLYIAFQDPFAERQHGELVQRGAVSAAAATAADRTAAAARPGSREVGRARAVRHMWAALPRAGAGRQVTGCPIVRLSLTVSL